MPDTLDPRRMVIGHQLNKLMICLNDPDHPLSRGAATAAVDAIIREANALVAERDALRAYARALELKWWNDVDNRASGHPDTDRLIDDFRREHGASDLMGDD